MPTSAPTMMIALVSFHHGERGFVSQYDQLRSDDPVVEAHSAFFASSTTPSQELRQLEADLVFASVQDSAYQQPAPPPPVKMRALRSFTIQRTVDEVIEAGTIVSSDDDTFVLNAQHFERADQPRRRGK